VGAARVCKGSGAAMGAVRMQGRVSALCWGLWCMGEGWGAWRESGYADGCWGMWGMARVHYWVLGSLQGAGAHRGGLAHATGGWVHTGEGWEHGKGARHVAKLGAHQYMAVGGRPSVGHMKGTWGAHKTCQWGCGMSVGLWHVSGVVACQWGHGMSVGSWHVGGVVACQWGRGMLVWARTCWVWVGGK